MSAITDITEAWRGHTGLEVETFLKQMLGSTISSLGGKIGYVALDGSTLKFYDEQGGNVISSISLSGDVYNITVACNLPQAFYVLGNETSKVMTITPSTTVSQFGSSTSTAYPETYHYQISVNSGNGYVMKIDDYTHASGDSVSFDIRGWLSQGDNYIRITVTGQLSGQVSSVVYTANLTNLWLTVSHAWQTAWNEGEDYVINGIRFSGNLAKRLHIAVWDGSEWDEVDYVDYSASQNYSTTSTTYTIPSSAFPAGEGSDAYGVKLWMTAQGVSTPEAVFNILCVATGDDTPLIAINEIVPVAYNWTSGKIFGYAVYGADKASFDLTASLGGQTYTVATGVEATDLVPNTQYEFAYSMEVDTGANSSTTGTLNVAGTAYYGETTGESDTVSTTFDNTYSYLATPGALFYLNASTRANSQSNRETIVNEMGASANFPATYSAEWTNFSWDGDGWDSDPEGHRALVIPAGCTLAVADLHPLSVFNSYPEGMTIEVMLRSQYPADYDSPVLSLYDNEASPSRGIVIYPTKIVVIGSTEQDEISQSVNICENQITHLIVSFVKGYEGNSGMNLVSIYVNGISNSNFSFGGTFGAASLVLGQMDTDVYLYKMRVYGTALDSQAVFNNFLNCIIDGVEFTRSTEAARNNLLSGSEINYELVKQAGYNTMVVIMDDDAHAIPSFTNQASFDGCSLRFEYAGTPSKNVTVENVSLDGQGTTSKKYYRWNLRAKTGDSTTWTYGDGTSDTGKKGRVINDSSYIKVDRITAKKNYASSMQGHKMGFTGLYNDLFKQCGLGSHIPDSDYQVAVYQFPFVGFRYYSNGDYEYIGIYTAGPDKGSKVTFGYKKDDYPNLLSIEGPNHTPRGTRFLHPWVDVTYSPNDETLCFGGEEGWDCDYVKYETSTKGTQADWDAILALYTSEWKPAYELAYHCSPYIASLSDALTEGGYADIAAVNADITNFFKKSTGGVPNNLLSFYDANYDIWFYRTKNEAFENLTTVEGSSEHNILTYLGLTGTPTTAQIISARAAKFKTDAPSYWDIDQSLYHYCFCELYGISDNFAKNTYPFKFRAYAETLAEGESTYCKRWGWREDDMDTALMTDNNGNNTKEYSVEPGDTTIEGVQIFQGYNSSFWRLIHDNYQTELRDMMLSIANAAASKATSLGIAGSGLHGSLFNLTSYYCWEHSAKYFAQTLYESDKRWAYIEPWLLNPEQTYNGVFPLTQALGDQYQGERLWMERRIAYIFSKYHIGAFDGATEGYNEIAFTLASSYTFTFIPAIDLYPAASSGSTTSYSGRTEAGQESDPISVLGDGETTNYIKGGDWLADLGDLCDMALSARGGGSKNFSVKCARLLKLKVGDANANNVDFNADNLAITSPSITEIDARNTATVRNIVDLRKCTRLRKVLFEGSGATGMYLPVGAKVTEVSFPDGALILSLISLPLLENSGLKLPALAGIEQVYISNCKHINAFIILEAIINTENYSLQYATAVWEGVFPVPPTAFDSLLKMSTLDGRVTYENGAFSNVDGTPYIEGALDTSQEIGQPNFYPTALNITLDEAYGESLRRMWVGKFNTRLPIIYDPVGFYPDNFIDDGYIWAYYNVTDTSAATPLFYSSYTDLTVFGSDFIIDGQTVSATLSYQFTTTGEHLVKMLPATVNVPSSSFRNVAALRRLYLPDTYTGANQYAVSYNANLTHLWISEKITTIAAYAFRNNSALLVVNLFLPNLTTFGNSGVNDNYSFTASYMSRGIVDFPKLTTLGTQGTFANTSIIEIKNLGTITSLPRTNGSGFCQNCTSLKKVNLPATITTVGAFAFSGCSSLKEINLPKTITSIGRDGFRGSKIDNVIDLPNLTGGLNGSFYGTYVTEIKNLGSVTSLLGTSGAGGFRNCTKLEKVVLPASMTDMTNGFNGCTSLKEVTIYATTPPTYSGGLASCPIEHIYVPSESVTAYQTASGWSGFASKISAIPAE